MFILQNVLHQRLGVCARHERNGTFVSILASAKRPDKCSPARFTSSVAIVRPDYIERLHSSVIIARLDLRLARRLIRARIYISSSRKSFIHDNKPHGREKETITVRHFIGSLYRAHFFLILQSRDREIYSRPPPLSYVYVLPNLFFCAIARSRSRREDED